MSTHETAPGAPCVHLTCRYDLACRLEHAGPALPRYLATRDGTLWTRTYTGPPSDVYVPTGDGPAARWADLHAIGATATDFWGHPL